LRPGAPTGLGGSFGVEPLTSSFFTRGPWYSLLIPWSFLPATTILGRGDSSAYKSRTYIQLRPNSAGREHPFLVPNDLALLVDGQLDLPLPFLLLQHALPLHKLQELPLVALDGDLELFVDVGLFPCMLAALDAALEVFQLQFFLLADIFVVVGLG
jgi:hypothetical protein